MRRLAIVLALAGVAAASVRASAQAVDDPFSDYLQRSDTILFGAGNAAQADAEIQTITPWPPYVGNTRIHIDGRRSVDAVEQMHRVPNPFARQGAGGMNAGAGTGAAASSTGSPGNASSGPVQPASNGY